jgi:hypothetical protein
MDSAGNTLIKDLKIKFNEAINTQEKNKGKEKEKLALITNPKDGEKVTSEFKYQIDFSLPIIRFDLDQISLLADTITPIDVQKEEITWNNTFTSLKIEKNIVVKKNIRINIPKAAFFSVQGDTSSKVLTTHELKDPEDFGTISGTIATSEENFIIQLLSADNKVVAEQINSKKYNFSYLNAGKYTIRLVIDANANGKWDAGNFMQRIVPEKIIYHKNEISLKENWDYPGNDFVF